MPSQGPTSTRVLRPFVPQDRWGARAQGASLPDRTEGTALFADLAGFTEMTRVLGDELGPRRGAEALSTYLTRTFDALIEEVERQRGSVIGFSGDAITCWFDQDDGARVLAAGHAMQRSMDGVPPVRTPSGSEYSLGLKVAAVRGPVRRFVVGDPAIQRIDVLAGETLDRLERCEGLAARGEVVVDGSLVGVEGVAPIRTRTASDGEFAAIVVGHAPSHVGPVHPRWPEPTDVDDAWTGEWVLPAVQERLLHGLDAQAADFRPVTALFLGFEGIAYDADASAGEKLDGFVRWVQRTVAARGGAVVQLTVGDKGAYLYVSFGAPLSHEDDAVRAVDAALRLTSPPQPSIENVRIGLAHGQMYTGTYGGLTRRTFGVLGSKTNLAARLMMKARAGGVLCDDAVVREARRRWTFVPRPPLRLKGFAEPVPVFEPDAPAAADVRHMRPLVGRSDERAQLLGALDRVEAGSSAVVVIEGDAGIGKSHLASWLSERAASRGHWTSRVRGPDLADSATYAGWRQLTRELMASGHGGSAATTDRTFAVLEPDLRPWTPLLGEIAGLPLTVEAPTVDLAPEARRAYLARMLAALLRADDGHVRTIVFDDAQRWDSLSWELLTDVVAELRASASRVLLTIAYRPREVPGSTVRLMTRVKEEAETVLRMAELSADATAEMIASVVDVPRSALPEDVVTAVMRQGGGNPTYAEEVVAAFGEVGAIEVDRTKAPPRVRFHEDAQGHGAGVPQTLHGLVQARLDRAAVEDRTLLQLASVVGLGFDLPTLHAAFPAESVPLRADVRDRLARLEERQLVASEPHDRFAFRHALVHEVAYESLLFAQRRQVHASLASWYERDPTLSDSERTPVLAHHTSRAAEGSGDASLLARATELLAAAAGGYERSGAFPEAVAALRKALELAVEGRIAAERRARLLVALGTALEHIGSLPEARTCFDEVAAMAAPPEVKATAMAGICLVETRRGQHDEARAAGHGALALVGDDADAPLGALVRGRLGILAALDGDLSQAEAYFDEAQRRYRSENQPRNAASWLNNLGLARILQERYGEALRPLQEALSLAEAAGAQDVEAQVHTNLGLAAHREGRLDEAAQHYERSLGLARAMRTRHEVVTLVVNLGDLALARGSSEEAWLAYREAATDAVALGAMPKALDALRGAAEVLHARGRHAQAATVLGFVLVHPDRNVEVKVEADRVREMLEASVDANVLAPALEKGETSTLEQVLDLLASVSRP